MDNGISGPGCLRIILGLDRPCGTYDFTEQTIHASTRLAEHRGLFVKIDRSHGTALFT